MNEINVEFDLPSVSEEISSEVSFAYNKSNIQIKYHYYDENMVEKEFLIEIFDVYKFIFTSDSCCNPFQIENSFERIISLNKSDLLEEARQNAINTGINFSKENKHFMMYISDYGCYESIAEKITCKILDNPG